MLIDSNWYSVIVSNSKHGAVRDCRAVHGGVLHKGYKY